MPVCVVDGKRIKYNSVPGESASTPFFGNLE